MKKIVASCLLVLLVCFCLLPSFEFSGNPENYVRVVKQVEVKGEVFRPGDRKSTRLNSSHGDESRMPSSA